MGNSDIREPIQKRSIEKKERIIEAGFELICSQGYYNTNTAEIAKVAGVSTGIVYQYFKDKHAILIEGINLHSNSIFYPMLNIKNMHVTQNNLEPVLRKMIKEVERRKITEALTSLLSNAGFTVNNLKEKVHIAINLIDDLCHEIVYHKHSNMNYPNMIDIVLNTIINLLK